MSTRIGRGGRWLATTGALALVVGSLALGSSASMAATVPETLPAADAEGTLTIHKRTSVEGATAAAPSTIPVPGAGFTVYSLSVGDLTTPGAWKTVSELTLNGCDALSGATSVKGAAVGNELVTDTNGDVTSPTLSLGAYLVCETSPVTELAGKHLVLKSDPFIVTIPYPDSTAPGGWQHDVAVWPKNSYNTFTKEIVDNEHIVGAGDEVSFNVISEVPVVDPNNTLTSFDVSDYFDRWLGGVTLDSVTLPGGATLPADAYTSTMEIVDGRALSWVRFDVDKIKAYAGQKITLKYTASVVESIGTETFPGAIDNEAFQFVNTPGTDSTTKPGEVPPVEPPVPPVVTPKVFALWAPLDLLKFEEGDVTQKRLAGAEFTIYETTGDPYAATCSATPDTTAVGSITSSDPMNVVWLYINDSNNDEANSGAQGGDDLADLAKTRCYVLVETKAPTGFILDTTPRAVKMEHGKTATQPVVAAIPNVKGDVPDLPLTGGAGQAALVLGGLTLAGAGIVLMALRQRKNAKQAI